MEEVAIDEMAAIEDHHWWFVGKRLLVAALLGDRLTRPDLRVLDVGCGTGGVLAHLAERATTVGVDRSRQALAHCRRRGLTRLAVADMDRVPFAPATFDVILMLDVLEHFHDDVAVVANARPLLRPGGALLVSVPAHQSLWSPHDEVLHHVRRYDVAGVRRALESGGFRIRRLTYTNVVALPPAAIVRGMLPRLGFAPASADGTDFRTYPDWVNRLLAGAYRLEAAALRALPKMPFGLSIAAVAELA
jgi:SAM-dependent methyltransferase